MTLATELITEWNAVITSLGNTVTIYNPTRTYNTEKDVSAYTLGTGTSATMITLQDPDGTTYSTEVEGVDDRLSLRALIKTTDTVDNETIIKKGTVYYEVVGGSYREIEVIDTVVAKRAILRKMLPQEAAKIA